WRSTLREALALGSEHLSCYEVIYEEDTPLFAQLQAGAFSVDEDLACAMYDELLEQSAARGFLQYEVANFARPLGSQHLRDSRNSPPVAGSTPPVAPEDEEARPSIPAHACRHNINYWHGGSYLGLGPSAAGYAGGVRTKNVSNTSVYCERLEGNARAI